MKSIAILALLGLVGTKHHKKSHRLVQFAAGDYGFDDMGEDIKMNNKPQHFAQKNSLPSSLSKFITQHPEISASDSSHSLYSTSASSIQEQISKDADSFA